MAVNDFRNTELAFNPGGRPYNNKDFQVLQQLVLDSVSLLNAFQNVNSGEFIVSGCTNLGDAGFIWLGAYNIDPSLNDRKLRYVDTYTGTPLTYPCYIGETLAYQTRTYKDGNVKNVFVISAAYWSQTIPASGDYLTFNNSGDFASAKLSTTLASIGASFWTQVPSTSNIEYLGGNVGIGKSPTSPWVLDINGPINTNAGGATIGGGINVTGGGGVITGGLTVNNGLLVPSGNITVTGNIRADAGASTGSVTLSQGTGSQAGYVEFRLPNATRQGYMGWITNGLGVTLENSNNLIISGGNVGIGTSSITHTLEVAGSMNVSGAANVSGGLSVSSGLTVSSGTLTVSSGTLNMTNHNINNLANGASGNDAVNLNQLNAEASARSSADSSLSSSISTVSSNLSAETTNRINGDNNLQTQINALSSIPSGGIIMWTGTTAPSGWHLCDGSGGTPDLRGRFIVGYNASDSDYSSIGNFGGNKFHTIAMSEIPGHNHVMHAIGQITGSGGPYYINRSNGAYSAGGSDQFGRATSIDTGMQTGYAGGAGGSTTSPGSAQPFNLRPPYYTLAYIMKL